MAISAAITKGSVVEVSIEEPGFYGAWYVATFLDEDKRSPTKKRRSHKKNNRTSGGYLVKYHTLEEDFGGPLTEVVDSSLVRPAPPRVARRNNGDTVKELVEEEEQEGCGDEFEVYDVIDAFHRDGWWKGIVKTVIVEGETKKYVVSFEDPPEDVEFDGSQLRFHVDWVKGRWLIPPRKKPEQEGDGGNAATDPAASEEVLILDPDNAIVCTPFSDKKKLSRSRKSSGSNSSVSGSVTYSRNRRTSKLVEADSVGKSFQAIAGSTVNAKTTVTAMETSGSDDINQDSPSMEPEKITTQTNGAENGSASQKRKRERKKGRPARSGVKPVAGVSLEDGCVVVTESEEPPLAVGQHQLKRSSCLNPQDNVGTTDYQENWPFVKRSAIWATVDSLGSYLATQKPHFSPLIKEREENREGLAIAHLVTFGSLVERVQDLQTTDPSDTIHNYMETALELETHGFDVGPIRVHLNEMLSLKSKMSQQKDKLEEVEKEIEKCSAEKCEMEKEMDEFKAALKDLEEKLAKTVDAYGVKEREWLKLQSSLETLSQQRNDLNEALKKLAGTPLL